MFLNPTYFVFALPALLLALWAQARVRAAYGKYLRVPNDRGITGLEAAQQLLGYQGLSGINIEGTPGELTDHYDPRSKTLRLSQGVAHSRSLAALSIVAHEVGHAVQDYSDYGPMKLRAGIVPMVQVSSWVAPLIFFAGLLLGSTGLATLGLILFSTSALFALLTLPVELNASQRALQMLTTTGMVVGGQEEAGARAVLDAAAWTYVAALVQVLATLLYYSTFLFGGFGRRRR
jgi:hypothetical protein